MLISDIIFVCSHMYKAQIMHLYKTSDIVYVYVLANLISVGCHGYQNMQ